MTDAGEPIAGASDSRTHAARGEVVRDIEAWQPANATERAMVEAASVGDRREFFRIIAGAELVLPRVADDGEGQRFLTASVLGETYLLVYTSVAEMVARLPQGIGGYSMTTYAELRSRWPSPDVRLAVNAGSPLEAYVAIDAIEDAAAGDLVLPTMAELVEEAGAAQAGPSTVEEVEAALAGAAAAGDVDRYLRVLLDVTVLLPTERVVADPEEILEPDFPWLRSGPPEQPVIEVFTSQSMLERAHQGGLAAVTVALPFALAMWPAECGISINPGDPAGVELPADQVPWLLLWGSTTDYEGSPTEDEGSLTDG